MELQYDGGRVELEKDHAAMSVDLKLVQRPEGRGGPIYALGVKLPQEDAQKLGKELLRLSGGAA